jgi:hypothetical protein
MPFRGYSAVRSRGAANTSSCLRRRSSTSGTNRGVHCSLLYRLKLRDRTTHRSATQLFLAQLLRGDECPPPTAPDLLARYHGRADNTIRTPTFFVPEARMVVYPFPIDPSLPWLLDAVDPEAMERHLAGVWAQRELRVRNVTVELLRYAPQTRAALVYEVLGEAEVTGRSESRRVIGKLHRTRRAAHRFATNWALWRAADGRLGLPPRSGTWRRSTWRCRSGSRATA